MASAQILSRAEMSPGQKSTMTMRHEEITIERFERILYQNIAQAIYPA